MYHSHYNPYPSDTDSYSFENNKKCPICGKKTSALFCSLSHFNQYNKNPKKYKRRKLIKEQLDEIKADLALAAPIGQVGEIKTQTVVMYNDGHFEAEDEMGREARDEIRKRL